MHASGSVTTKPLTTQRFRTAQKLNRSRRWLPRHPQRQFPRLPVNQPSDLQLMPHKQIAGHPQDFPHGRNRPVQVISRQPLKLRPRSRRQTRPWPPKPERNRRHLKPRLRPHSEQVLPHHGPVIMRPPTAITHSSRRGSSRTTGLHTHGHPIRNRRAGNARGGQNAAYPPCGLNKCLARIPEILSGPLSQPRHDGLTARPRQHDNC